jgi:hypothetical protein
MKWETQQIFKRAEEAIRTPKRRRDDFYVASRTVPSGSQTMQRRVAEWLVNDDALSQTESARLIPELRGP